MTEAVIAALFGLGGAVLVAVSSSVTQWKITGNVIEAERAKISEQIHGEAEARALERRHDRLLEAIVDLLAASDPQISPGGDYSSTVRQIHRIQLVLNRKDDAEFVLYNAVNRLGLVLQEFVDIDKDEVVEALMGTRDLFVAHSDVIEAAKVVLKTDMS